MLDERGATDSSDSPDYLLDPTKSVESDKSVEFYSFARNLCGNLNEEILRGQGFVGTNLNFHTRFPPRFLTEGYPLTGPG